MRNTQPHREINLAIKEYLAARARLIDIGAEYPELISGNDNIIGRIGEYFAILFLRQYKGQDPIKPDAKNEKGFDLPDRKNSNLTTQVKLITSENQYGAASPLHPPWKQFVLIDIDLSSLKAHIGFITNKQFRKSIKENHIRSEKPFVSRTMLKKEGLFGKYGEVFEAIFDLEKDDPLSLL